MKTGERMIPCDVCESEFPASERFTVSVSGPCGVWVVPSVGWKAITVCPRCAEHIKYEIGHSLRPVGKEWDV